MHWLLRVICLVASVAIGSTAGGDYPLSASGGARAVGEWLDGQWSHAGDRLRCSLSRDLPGYGTARFQQRAQHLSFDLVGRASITGVGGSNEPVPGQLQLRSPPWHPSHPLQRDAVALRFATGKESVRLDMRDAQSLLQGLRDGLLGEFQRADGEPLAVPGGRLVVSGVGFARAYQGFSECLAELISVSFEAVERTSLHFRHDVSVLDTAAKRQLDQVVLYCKQDPQITRIFVDGHTDNSGSPAHNLALAQARSDATARYLMAQGVPQKLLNVRFHGERYPVADNKDEAGRMQNRRATVRMERGGE